MNRVEGLPLHKRDDLSEKTVMVVDNGLFVEIAKTLSKSFKRVLYFCPWVSGFPKSTQYVIGEGIEGIERVHYLFDHFDEVDLFCFPDIYFSDIQLHLESLGKLVFGGRKGDQTELMRYAMKEHMKQLGLYVHPYKVVNGIDDLRKHLQKHDNQYVKIDCTRGDFESFHAKNYEEIEPVLDEVEAKLGAVKYIKEFIVEDAYDNAAEIGIDCYCIDGQYPSKTLVAVEIKDLGAVGKFIPWDTISPKIRDYNEKIAPTLADYGYRGFISSEVRISKDKKPYMLDSCARAASPPSELYQLMYTNLADIIWYGSKGILIDPVVEHKYGAEAMIHSAWADKNWQAISFPEKYRDNIKLRNACVINGKYYCAPQSVGLAEIGAVVAVGDTLKEAIEECKKIAETISGHYIEVKTESFDRALEEFKKLESFGIKIL